MLLGAECEVPAAKGQIAVDNSEAAGATIRSPQIRWVLVPKSDCRVIDDWHVLGLRGSGSKSVVISDAVFVPEYRTVLYDDLVAGRALGRRFTTARCIDARFGRFLRWAFGAGRRNRAWGVRTIYPGIQDPRVWVDYSPQAKNPAVQMRVARRRRDRFGRLLYERASRKRSMRLWRGDSNRRTRVRSLTRPMLRGEVGDSGR